MPTASLIAIGTEIIAGDVNNSNSQWLSHRLFELGIKVKRHISIEDDREEVAKTLELCSDDSQIIMTTGGLGPTADDFTREVVAKWCNSKLDFDQESWDQLVNMLTEVGVEVAESNRQQCYFPQGASKFENTAGTANAFSVSKDKTTIICLPGPPREIEAIWGAGLKDHLADKFGESSTHQWLRWHCIGISESSLGEIVEEALDGSEFLTAYRPQIPYVEVKVYAPINESISTNTYLRKLEKVISPHTAFRGNKDLVERIFDHIPANRKLEISDSASLGVIANRLFRTLRLEKYKELADKVTVLTSAEIHGSSKGGIFVRSKDINTWHIEIDGIESEVTYPRKVTPRTLERMHKHCTELFLLTLAKSWSIDLDANL